MTMEFAYENVVLDKKSIEKEQVPGAIQMLKTLQPNTKRNAIVLWKLLKSGFKKVRIFISYKCIIVSTGLESYTTGFDLAKNIVYSYIISLSIIAFVINLLIYLYRQ